MNFDHYCIYLAGFDRLGRHLYGSWWTGNEYHAYPVDAPEEITQERQQILADIDKTLEVISEIRIKRRHSLLSYQQSSELDAKYEFASLRNTELNQQLNDLPRDVKGLSVDYENYQRRRATEECLKQALENDALMAWFGLSPMGMRWSDWGNRDGYTLYPELSMIHTKNHGHGRRMTVFFKISELEEWLKTIEPFNPENKTPPTLEETYKSLIKEFISKSDGSYTKPLVKAYLEETLGEIVVRAFDRAWRNEESIPAFKKKPGRPKK